MSAHLVLRRSQCFLNSALQTSHRLAQLLAMARNTSGPRTYYISSNNESPQRDGRWASIVEAIEKSLNQETPSTPTESATTIFANHESTITQTLFGLNAIRLTKQVDSPYKIELDAVARSDLLYVSSTEGGLPKANGKVGVFLKIEKENELDLLSFEGWQQQKTMTPFFACELVSRSRGRSPRSKRGSIANNACILFPRIQIHRATYEIMAALHSPPSPPPASRNVVSSDDDNDQSYQVDPASAL